MTDAAKILTKAHEACALNPQGRAMSIDVDGKRLWVKQGVVTSPSSWQKFQKALFYFMPQSIFRATATYKDGATIQSEVVRLRLFKEKGIHVPDVLAADEKLFVLNDVGINLETHLRGLLDTGAQVDVLKIAAAALGHLHQQGLVQGRGFIRDFMWQDGVIYFIDLEEDTAAEMPLDKAQAREVWLFMGNVVRFTKTDAQSFIDVFHAYQQTGPVASTAALKKFVRTLKPLRMIAEKLVAPFAGKDVKRSVIANKILEKELG